MKKRCCFIFCLLLLCLASCGKKAEPDPIYVDEGTEETEEAEIRDVAILSTAGLAKHEISLLAKASAARNDAVYTYLRGYVGLVDLGGTVGSDEEELYSRLDAMNYVGYDAACAAPEDFSLGIQTLFNAANTAEHPLLCCNLLTAETEMAPLSSWTVAHYGGISVAYVGFVAEKSVEKSLLVGETETVYTLTDSAETLQTTAEKAREAGAQYVVVLCSCGRETVQSLLENVTGVDAVLDGGGEGQCETLQDAAGGPVTYLGQDSDSESIGQLTISAAGEITAQILTELEDTDSELLQFAEQLGFAVPEVTASAEPAAE